MRLQRSSRLQMSRTASVSLSNTSGMPARTENCLHGRTCSGLGRTKSIRASMGRAEATTWKMFDNCYKEQAMKLPWKCRSKRTQPTFCLVTAKCDWRLCQTVATLATRCIRHIQYLHSVCVNAYMGRNIYKPLDVGAIDQREACKKNQILKSASEWH